MADKSVGELIAAQSVTPTDLFVLEQNGTAKKLTGQILENWLVSFADGHGGIHSIEKVSTSGLVDTYRITLADTTTFDFMVTNGKEINSVSKVSTSGLVDTYQIEFNDGTSSTFTVTNGAKGDKGDNANIWVKYASQKPTVTSHSFGDIPDAWIGISSGHLTEAPTDWQQYTWYQWKGDKGDTGEPAVRLSVTTAYQVGDAGNIIPSGSWLASIPYVAPGKYLWIRKTTVWNKGDPDVDYSISRMGIDGSGAVSTVAGVGPDANGNVPLTADDVNALPIGGGVMGGSINMNGQPIGGLNAPTEDSQAANMGFVNQQMKKAAPKNFLDNSDFTNPVNQRGGAAYTDANVTIDRWGLVASGSGAYAAIDTTRGKFLFLNSSDGQVLYLYQRFVKGVLDEQKKYTAAWLTSDGEVRIGNSSTMNISFSNTAFDQVVFNLPAPSEIVWIALYEGEYTADTLPEYQSKGYGAELLACQTQLQRFRTESERKTYCEDFRPTMRVTPNGMVSQFEQEIDGVTYYFASAEL